MRQTLVDYIGVMRQRLWAKPTSLFLQNRNTILRGGNQAFFECFGNGLDNQQIPQAVQQILDKTTWLVTSVDDVVDDAEQLAFFVVRKRTDHAVNQRQVCHAQQRSGLLVGQLAIFRTGEQLIQQRQRIARRATTGLHHQRVDGIFYLHVFFVNHMLEQRLHVRWSQQTERIIVGTRADRANNFFRLRRRKDKNQVLRRLLDDLQQGVESLLGNHVRLVDDEDAVARFRRRVVAAVAQLAHIFHTVV